MASTNRNLKKMMEKQIHEWTKSNDIHYINVRFFEGKIIFSSTEEFMSS